MTYGESMKAARKSAGLSILDLEALSGISRGTVSFLERDIRNATTPTLEALADALGISIDEYIGHKVQAPAYIREVKDYEY